MNVVEKILQLKQDIDNVYEAGKVAGGNSSDPKTITITEDVITNQEGILVDSNDQVYMYKINDVPLSSLRPYFGGTVELTEFSTGTIIPVYIDGPDENTYEFFTDDNGNVIFEAIIIPNLGYATICNIIDFESCFELEIAPEGFSNGVFVYGDINGYVSKITPPNNSDGSYEQGYEDGKNSVVNYLPFVKTVQFNSLNDFGKTDVELNLDSCTTLMTLCYVTNAEYINTTVEHLTINNAKPIYASAMLQCSYACRDLMLKRLTLNFDTSNISTWQNAFNCLYALETIDGQPINLSSATNVTNIFMNMPALTFCRFVGESIKLSISFSRSPELSTDTIQSIIDGLADLTGSTTQTLTLSGTTAAYLTDTQKATITAKNWSLVY